MRDQARKLGAALDWAADQARAKGWGGVTVACEPTGHRWRVLGQLAADRGTPFVCVQPLLSSWARRSENLTTDKTDEKDAVLIARLTAQLRCYVPEPVDATWGRLRHLPARRDQLIVEMVRQVQQIRALLGSVWPAAVDTARQPFRSRTWAAAAGDKSAAVTWERPATNAPITGYTVTARPGGKTVTVAGDQASAVVTGLTNGTSYTFTVTARNADGVSEPSAPSNAVTPAAARKDYVGVRVSGGRSWIGGGTAPAPNVRVIDH